MTFYNDNDPFVCQWTRNLIVAGLISKGTVDERSIQEIQPSDLEGYERCHFFSGIAGWEAAINLSGWHGPVWSASLPCPAFSCAGKSEGFADARGQLWIPFLRLVRERRPWVIVGEQVPAAIRHGWLDRVFTDLEAEDYACGASVLGAHSSGAPHKRQRIYWIATLPDMWKSIADRSQQRPVSRMPNALAANGNGCVAYDQSDRWRERREIGRRSAQGIDQTQKRLRSIDCNANDADWLAQSASGGREQGDREQPPQKVAIEFGLSGAEVGVALGNANKQGPQGRGIDSGEHSGQQSAWSPSQFIQCADGKTRRIPLEPALFPLAPVGDGSRNRVGILRSSGNGLCIPTAAAFIQAVMECL